MPPKDPINWMLSEAIQTIARAERLHQQFLNLQPQAETHEPSWEPPIDVLETDREILIFIALPGVDPNEVEAVLDKGVLVVSGRRALPAELRNARMAVMATAVLITIRTCVVVLIVRCPLIRRKPSLC